MASPGKDEKVELLSGLNNLCVPQVVQLLRGRMRSVEPVSRRTVKFWGGVPT
jgi:hypothetical protein